MKELNKKGQAGMIASVTVMVTLIVLLFVSLLLVSKVRSSVANDVVNESYNVTSGEGLLDYQLTFDEVNSNVNTAFTLTAIAVVVLVAFLIISILRG